MQSKNSRKHQLNEKEKKHIYNKRIMQGEHIYTTRDVCNWRNGTRIIEILFTVVGFNIVLLQHGYDEKLYLH